MSQINYPKLALPDGEETTAYRAVDQALRADPTLENVVETWASWRGEQEDVIVATQTKCPMIRLSPGGLPSDWETEGQHTSPLEIGIQAAIAGTDAHQLMNLWAAIRRALFPRDPDARDAMRAKMRAAGISKGTLTKPVYGSGLDTKSGARVLIAEGSVKLLMLISTP